MSEIVSTSALQTLARRLLRENPVTQGATHSTLNRLWDESVVRRHANHSCLIVRDQPVDALQLVVKGSLEVSVDGPDGTRAICWYVGPGQWFGMIPVIDGGGAIHTARAHGDIVLLHIPARSFLTALDADSRLARGCLLMLCERGRSVYGNLASEGLMPLRGRLARHLVMLLEHHATDGRDGVDLPLQVSQEELAAMLAATRQRLNRELKALESEGIISLSYKRIRVLNRDALRLQAVETLLPSGR